tara:strand:+ start:1942 stop:2058 length:117 start_codon:yes stop_codon:yes gene_type:complete
MPKQKHRKKTRGKAKSENMLKTGGGSLITGNKGKRLLK